MDEFISEEDLATFEGFLKYQRVLATITPDELKEWRVCFAEQVLRGEKCRKVGLMQLQRKTDEQKYAVAIKDGTELWLTL